MDLEEIRTLTLAAIQNFSTGTQTYGGTLQIMTLKGELNALLKKKGINIMTEEDESKVLDVVNNLMIEGVIMWGRNLDPIESKAPFISVTSYGQKVLKEGKIIPHDPDRYLEDFRIKIPSVSPLILMYLTESVQCFLRNNLVASSVMLGVATEAAFDILFDAVKNALTNNKRTQRFSKLENSISTKQKFDAVRNEIIRIRKQLPYEVAQNIETEIDGIFTLIRRQRNDSGHPTGKAIGRDEMFVSLRLFFPYCSHIYEVVNWLHGNKI